MADLLATEDEQTAMSCFDPVANPGGMMTVSDSIRFVRDSVKQPALSKERCVRILLKDAVNRVLAENLVSTLNVPNTTNAAMDGFAIKYADHELKHFRLIGQAFAGHGFAGKIDPGDTVKIMTGAPMPKGFDTVVIKEAATVSGDQVALKGLIKEGQHVRQAGEDLQCGQLALAEGTLIRPQELGLLASLGLEQVTVYPVVKVAIFSTGDEVYPQAEVLPEQGIYDTNRFTLHGLLVKLGCEVIDLGIIEDNEASLTKALEQGAAQADCVISSGGVSMGEADYIRDALSAAGNVGFWRIAMRPGRPFAFGHVGNCPFFGLPGNPVAVMVTFLQFVQPALRKMMGQNDWQPIKVRALAEEPLRSRVGRTDYSRGIYRINEEGQLVVKSTGAQGSGILTSMVRANCLIEISDELERVNAGEWVTIQPFSDLL